MAGGQQITTQQGNLGVSISGGATIALQGQQVSALPGNVWREFVTEDTFITVSTGIARAGFAIPLKNKQTAP